MALDTLADYDPPPFCAQPPPLALADVFNHSSAAVINGQTFQEWFLDTYMFNEVGASPLVSGFYWDDTWYAGGVGDDPEAGMLADMGLTKADLRQLTASYDATMAVLRNRTVAAGKFGKC